MNANKAASTCKDLGITCKISYVYSNKTKGTVFNQSMNAGSKVIGDTTIVLTVSNGPKPSSNGSNSNNNQSFFYPPMNSISLLNGMEPHSEKL